NRASTRGSSYLLRNHFLGRSTPGSLALQSRSLDCNAIACYRIFGRAAFPPLPESLVFADRCRRFAALFSEYWNALVARFGFGQTLGPMARLSSWIFWRFYFAGLRCWRRCCFRRADPEP